MNQIVIKFIPHKKQRYETVGDYWTDKRGNLQIRISRFPIPIVEQCVAIHELVEAIMVNWNGLDFKIVDQFDLKYERERKKGLHGLEEEPGFDKNCPYRNEHTIATSIEMLIIGFLGFAWSDYEKIINSV
jgi:hypothetical protein